MVFTGRALVWLVVTFRPQLRDAFAGKCFSMPAQGLSSDLRITEAIDRTSRPRKKLVHYRLADPNGFENLGTLIAEQRADAHFGHDLQQALL